MAINNQIYNLLLGKKLKWPKRILIVRHGESDQNVAEDLFQEDLKEILKKLYETRDADIQITSKGTWQSQQTGKYLAHEEPFDICLCSPYARTIQTAENIIAQLPYKLKIHKDDRLREKGFGTLHALSKEEIKEKFPEEYHARKRDGKYYYCLPGGENYPNVGMRVHSIASKLIRDHANQNVLIVTHAVPARMFRAMYEHLGEKEVLALEDIANCGMVSFIRDTSKVPEGRMKLEFYNKIVY